MSIISQVLMVMELRAASEPDTSRADLCRHVYTSWGTADLYPRFPFILQEKAEYHFCSILRRAPQSFLSLDTNSAVSSFPQQTKQQHRLAVIINFVQEARV